MIRGDPNSRGKDLQLAVRKEFPGSETFALIPNILKLITVLASILRTHTAGQYCQPLIFVYEGYRPFYFRET